VKLMTQRPLDHDPTPSAPFAAAGSESTQEYRTQPYLEGSTREDGSGSTEGQSTKDKAQQVAGTAKGEAKNVAGTAVDSGKDVARTAKDEAAQVASEAKHQAASLFDTVRSEASQQVSTSQNRIAEALHGLSKELGGMASSSSESGPLTDLAHEASRRGGEVAHWLQDREPADVLEAVRSYARRRPVAFLAICGLAGVVAGRITRSTVATRTSVDSKDHHTSTPDSTIGTGYAPSYDAGTGIPAGVGAPSGYAVPAEPAPTYTTGVLGATPETTEPAGGGFVGTSPLNDPDGGPIR
jgi:hypothetical protein